MSAAHKFLSSDHENGIEKCNQTHSDIAERREAFMALLCMSQFREHLLPNYSILLRGSCEGDL